MIRFLIFIFISLILLFVLLGPDFTQVSENDTMLSYLENNTAIGCDPLPQPASYEQAWYNLLQKRRYEIDISVTGENLCESASYRDALEISTWKDDYDYWRQVYVSLIQFDNPKMQAIFQQFEQLRVEKNLDYVEFAEAVVTFIQDIPYVLVLNKSAEDAIKDGDFYRNYIEVEKRPYIENIKHGIHSPVEFLYTLKGDCDTRTIFAYTILSYFEYDVVIVNTSEHSMLGINIPWHGASITHHAKKYYLWEVTQPGWALGMVSPEHQQNQHICVPSLHEH